MLILEAAIQPTSKKHPNFKRLLNVGEKTVRHTDADGKVFFDNLDQGTSEYGNVDFTTAKEDVNYSGKWYFYECLYEITNNATFKMPMTGDDGKWKYGFIGLGIAMAVSTGFVICNTKNKKAKKRKHKK